MRLYARQAAELTDSTEARRLAALLNGPLRADGQSYDVQIYLTDEVNAFAMADGTIPT